MFQLPRPGRGVKALMAILAVSWIAFVLLAVAGGASVAAVLPLVPAQLLRGFLWQPLTAMLLQPPSSIGAIAVQLFILWFAVSPMEDRLGTRKLLQAFFGAGLVGNLLTAALTLAASALLESPPRLLDDGGTYLGSGSAVLGVWVAGIGTARGQILRTGFLGEIKAEHLAAGLVGLGVLLSFGGGGAHPVGELAAGAFGWWWGTRGRAQRSTRPAPPPRAAPRFEVLEGGNENPGRAGRGWRSRAGGDEQWH
jgi:membrane associated rhomboid family serine protease